MGSKTRSAGRVPRPGTLLGMKGVSGMDIIFKGRRTDVQERFRSYASAKLGRITKLAHKAIRVDVEVSAERNPRQSGRRERVELTILSRGPAIRAEAAADDRFAALDRALAKLEERLRRSGDRRKSARHGAPSAGRIPGPRSAGAADLAGAPGARLVRRAQPLGPGRARAVGQRRGAGPAGRGGRPSRPPMTTWPRKPPVSSPSRWRGTARSWSGRSSTRPRRSASTRRSSKWNWSGTTSTCSGTSGAACRASSTAGTAISTG